MKVKPAYKQTEVGLIPEQWDVRRLADLLEQARSVRYGIVQPGKFESRGCLMLRSQDYSKGWAGPDEMHRVNGQLEIQYKNARIRRDDLIMTIVGAGIGQVVIAPAWLDGAILSRSTARIAVDNTQASRAFVKASLESPVGKRQILDSQKEGAQPVVSCRDLAKFFVPYPPPTEQRAIARALSDADALIIALDQLIAKKRDLKQAAMQHLLTGQKRLPGFHGEWEIKTLLDIAHRKKELFDDGDWIEAEFLTETGIRLIQTGNIGEGRFTERESKKYISSDSFKKLGCKELQVGDILICRLADPAGRACILPDIGEARMITAVDVTIFRPPSNVADRRYLVNVFNTPRWFEAVNERCGGSTRTRIARGQLGKMEIKLPPLPEQAAIAEVLSDMDAELRALEQRRDKTRARKQGMMQELLTGRTRLVA